MYLVISKIRPYQQINLQSVGFKSVSKRIIIKIINHDWWEYNVILKLKTTLYRNKKLRWIYEFMKQISICIQYYMDLRYFMILNFLKL